MFTPNFLGTFQQVTGRNLDGEETYSDPLPLQLSVVRLAARSEKTSVRSDSSASRGQADQLTADAVILTKNEALRVDDLVQVMDFKLRVVGHHPRLSVFGILDHYEIALEHVYE
ncbi:hypothetical protein B7L88_gp007 [Rhizobium phage RHEph10]|uniref:hypothetical protein n=1 Tax=Rhizobium phage RHEph10 TaxID=1220717 RepID=UPI0002AB0CEB|nr:hypothetical protein B7L88_gp007 [Rhizobium phage RHEph10]AGC36051.1 hypothetical protein RHEph10_gp007 [Rhizobium phage RHEph10]